MKASSGSITKDKFFKDCSFTWREICKENKCKAFGTLRTESRGKLLLIIDSCDGGVFVGGCFAEKERRAYFKECGKEDLLKLFGN